MVSSTEDPDTISKCFQSGAEDFLQKPVKLEMLKRRVEMCLEDRERRRKQTYYQDMLKRERATRKIEEKKAEDLKKELDDIKSQITDTIETPMQVVMKTVGDLMEGTYSTDRYKGALIAILKSLGSRDLYKPALSSVLNSDTMDKGTLKWLENEYLQKEDAGAPTHHHNKPATAPQPTTVAHQAQSTTAATATAPVATSSSIITTNHSQPDRVNTVTQQPREEKTSSDQTSSSSSPSTSNPSVEIRRTIPDLDSFHFSIFAYNLDEVTLNVANMFQELGLTEEFGLDTDKLFNFLKRIRIQYNTNPYHNYSHALDVTQFVFSSLLLEKAQILSPIEKLAMMVSGLCHDVDHPGLNNNYLINAKMGLALLYNDVSVLENHHCATTFRTLREPECNFVSNLTPDEFKEFRKCVVTTILATDMAHHFEILTKFQTRVSTTGILNKDSKDDRQQLMNIIMKIADVSNACRPYNVAFKWADLLIQEFLEQGDRERSNGMPISPLMDRNSLVRARMQVNFIDYIAGPLYKTAAQYMSQLTITTDTLAVNREIWSAQLEKDEEEMRLRMEKVALANNAANTTTTSPPPPSSSNTSSNAPQVDSTNGSAPQNNATLDSNVDSSQEEQDGGATIVGELKASDDITKARGVRVLLVEDDDATMQIMLSLLRDKVNYDIQESNSADEAFSMYQEKTFDVVVINVDMLDGINCINNIHQLNQTRTANSKYSKMTPIVGLLKRNGPITEITASQKGATKVLLKPVHKLLLLRTLEEVLEEALHKAEPVDVEVGLELVDNDPEFLLDLLNDLVVSAGANVEEMQDLIARKNELSKDEWKQLQMVSHSLKGSSAQLGAKPLSHSAFVIEKASTNCVTEPLDHAIELLAARVEELTTYMSEKASLV
ncbi:cyclic-nucleotide phosphodiesterase [Acrasis kona]|uniref:Phosphodiesterase n=1 Tax=Acrasis kona TaxID=1008807 RepID=A0AAW2YTA9_9EUKA